MPLLHYIFYSFIFNSIALFSINALLSSIDFISPSKGNKSFVKNIPIIKVKIIINIPVIREIKNLLVVLLSFNLNVIVNTAAVFGWLDYQIGIRREWIGNILRLYGETSYVDINFLMDMNRVWGKLSYSGGKQNRFWLIIHTSIIDR
jgi:hypothetical protein